MDPRQVVQRYVTIYLSTVSFKVVYKSQGTIIYQKNTETLMKGNNCSDSNGHRKSGLLKKCQLSIAYSIAIASMIGYF